VEHLFICGYEISAEESSIYRLQWLKNDGDCVEGMGYIEPPLPTPYDTYCKPHEVNFIVSLMIRSKGDEKGEFVPNYPKSNIGNKPSESSSSDSSSSSESERISRPNPNFKVGDRMKFKRNPNDNSVRRTGTITKVKCTRPDPVGNWNKCKDKSPYEQISGRPNWYRYEIGTLHQPEPGVRTRSYEFCDEGLIRILRENEALDHDDMLHGWQRQQESNPIESLNRSSDKNETKPVAEPIKSKRKCRNPKIDKKFDKNNLQGDEDTDTVSHLSLRMKGKGSSTLATISRDLTSLDEDSSSEHTKGLSNMEIDDYMEAVKDGLFDDWEEDIIKYPTTWNVDTILPIMEVGCCVSGSELGGTWPRDFYEALIRPDWRRWIEAVKDENESWNVFEACEEVTHSSIEQGASVIPLGELFTIKRNGKYKFRQIALGNLLKEGKDYAETFASTISGDGIRWFYSIASTCGRKIYGWDAKTGYLQTEATKSSYLRLSPVPLRLFGPDL
jgi:hypothetical protein